MSEELKVSAEIYKTIALLTLSAAPLDHIPKSMQGNDNTVMPRLDTLYERQRQLEKVVADFKTLIDENIMATTKQILNIQETDETISNTLR